jgi:hypothetical protein
MMKTRIIVGASIFFFFGQLSFPEMESRMDFVVTEKKTLKICYWLVDLKLFIKKLTIIMHKQSSKLVN